MQFIGPSSNEEMVTVFLRGELGSPRYADTIQAELSARGLDRALIEMPDLNERIENVQRAAMLLEYRPWLVDHGLLDDWPSNAVWQWAELFRATSEVPDDGDLETHLVVTNGPRTWEPDDLETVTTATETDPTWLQLRAAINNTFAQEE